jgi:SH3-like domain-containing protein
MFDALQNPIVIAIVVLVLLILIAIPVLLRRRRAAQGEVLPPPELGQAVDYTSMPYEEPTTLGERLRQAPVGVKLLLGLVPLAIIIAGVVLWYTFFSQPGGSANTPPAPPPEIRNVTATLAGPTRIVVDAETNLPNGTAVTATMKQDDQDFAWFNPDSNSAKGQVAGGKVSLVLERARTAPTPRRDQQQTIILNASANGQAISSQPAKLVVPAIHAREFYQEAAAAVPTAVPTAAPTEAAGPAPTAAPTEAPKPTPEPTAVPAELTATVFNGGNIRRQPKVTNDKSDVVGQLHAGEIVALLERSQDNAWYRVKAPEAEGWVSATLLTVDPAIAKQVAVAGQTPPATGLTAMVFNGGNVRERPVTGKVLDQINAKETVQLVEKTSDGAWYRITNIRNVTGWVSVTLLTIDSATAQKVPVAQ